MTLEVESVVRAYLFRRSLQHDTQNGVLLGRSALELKLSSLISLICGTFHLANPSEAFTGFEFPNALAEFQYSPRC